MKWVNAKAIELEAGDIVKSKSGALYTVIDEGCLSFQDESEEVQFWDMDKGEFDDLGFTRPMTIKDIDAEELADQFIGVSFRAFFTEEEKSKSREEAKDYIDAIKELMNE